MKNFPLGWLSEWHRGLTSNLLAIYMVLSNMAKTTQYMLLVWASCSFNKNLFTNFFRHSKFSQVMSSVFENTAGLLAAIGCNHIFNTAFLTLHQFLVGCSNSTYISFWFIFTHLDNTKSVVFYAMVFHTDLSIRLHLSQLLKRISKTKKDIL